MSFQPIDHPEKMLLHKREEEKFNRTRNNVWEGRKRRRSKVFSLVPNYIKIAFVGGEVTEASDTTQHAVHKSNWTQLAIIQGISTLCPREHSGPFRCRPFKFRNCT